MDSHSQLEATEQALKRDAAGRGLDYNLHSQDWEPVDENGRFYESKTPPEVNNDDRLPF